MNIVQKINTLIIEKKKIKVLTKDGWSLPAIPKAGLLSVKQDFHEGIRLVVTNNKGEEIDSLIFNLNEIIDVIGVD